MARLRVYLETSVVSYATSRTSRDVRVAAHQQITRDWLEFRAAVCDLYTSQLVIQEAAGGNPEAASVRRDFLRNLPSLRITDEAELLAARLIAAGVVPRDFEDDALHIALATVHGIDYLVTWNCRHIANAAIRGALEDVCRAAGFEPPIICTPEELLNDPGPVD